MNSEPEILIVDETTTALSLDGRKMLYDSIEKMRATDKGVILISHDLEEIMNTCTMLTVLRDGMIIGTLTKDEFDEAKIKAMMVGRQLTGDYYRGDFDGNFGEEVVLRAENIIGNSIVEDVSFELHKGEILGFGGLSGGGIRELGRMLFGLDKTISGSITLADGTVIKNASTAAKKGMGYVSKNRDEEAIMLDASIRNNIALTSLGKLTRKGFISGRAEKTFTKTVVEDMSVKCSGVEQLVSQLSGGNKQKVSFGKWIGNDSTILILDCPTRGVDVGVKQAMYQLIYALKQKGFSIVLISEELPELIGMSDRILIMKGGRITGEYPRSETLSEYELIQVMI
jgi:ribose transport system ATP-binding protein